jgi:hypothetical protein
VGACQESELFTVNWQLSVLLPASMLHAVLGQCSPVETEVYAELDLTKAIEVVWQLG